MNPLALARLLPGSAWLIAAALATTLATAAAAAWHLGKTREARAAGRAEVRAEWDRERALVTAAALRASLAARAEEQRRLAAQKETADEAERLSTRARDAAVHAAAAGNGLRQRAAAVAAACGAARSDSGAAGAGPPAAGAGLVLADVLGRLESAGRELAAEADRRGIAGGACERISDSLTTPSR